MDPEFLSQMQEKLDLEQVKENVQKQRGNLTERLDAVDLPEQPKLPGFQRKAVIGLAGGRNSNSKFLSKLNQFINVSKTRRGALSQLSTSRGVGSSHLDILNTPGETARQISNSMS